MRQGKLTPYRLGTDFRPIYPDVYVPKCAAPSLRTRSVAAWLWSGRRGVLAGLAAAAWHGSSWIDDDDAVEMVWRNPHPPAGVVTRSRRLDSDELARVAGLPVTTTVRTAFDLARQLPTGEAVARLDALKRAKSFSIEEVLLLVKRHPRARPAAVKVRTFAGRCRRCLSQGDVAAVTADQRGLAGPNDADTGAGELALHWRARYGLGELQSGRRVRR
jgi:hypothetical protein